MNLLLAITLSAFALSAPHNSDEGASVWQNASTTRRVATLLEEAGFNYRKTSDGVWVVSFRGDRAASVEVVVNAQDKMVLVFSTVRRQFAGSAAELRQLLEANYNANYSKLAIDEDGDLLSLSELPPNLTSTALRTAVDEVASLADTAFGLLGVDTKPGVAATETFENVPASGDATLSLVRGAFQLVYNSRKWKPQATSEGGVTQLNHVSGELWVRIIAERLEVVAPENLRVLAINNAKRLAPDAIVETETWRTVNGLRVLVLRYAGTSSGIKVTYYNQMYGGKEGLVQLAAWTSSPLFAEYRRELLELFAGFRKAQ